MSRTNMVSLVFLGVIVLSFGGGDNNVEALGVNWGTYASHKLPPENVVQLMKDNGIQKVKLFDADKSCLTALANSSIDVMIAVTNLQLQSMCDPDTAAAWVKENVLDYLPMGVNITYVGVGNEPFLKDYKDRFINVTLPALKNIQEALNKAGVGDKVKATVPFNGDVYYSPFWNPVPSAGLFRPDIADNVTDIVKYQYENGAPFIVNIYPFLSLYMSHGAFPFDYAFFDGGNSIQDGDIKYDNVLDANFDTCVSALKAAGYGNMTVVVGEIGWPTDGNEAANRSLASRFYNGLMPRLGANKGTPLRPGYMEIYLFSLLDEDTKSVLPGNFERHWGIFTYDGQPKFQMDFAGKNKNHTLVGAKDVEYQTKQWCVMKPNATTNATKIRANMDYSCKYSDCTPLAYGASCSRLNNASMTSYAFNQYFQVFNQSNGTCDFQGLAMITDEDPSQGKCNFTIQIKLASPAPAPSPSPAPVPHGGNSPDHDHNSPSFAAALQLPLAYTIMMAVFSFILS